MPEGLRPKLCDLDAAWAQHRHRLFTMLKKRIDPRLGAVAAELSRRDAIGVVEGLVESKGRHVGLPR